MIMTLTFIFMVENDGMRPQKGRLDRKELLGPAVLFVVLDTMYFFVALFSVFVI